MGDFVRWAAEKVPGFHAVVVRAEEADIVRDPSLSDGMWGAYDISRIQADTGWQPRPAREAFHAYMDWIAATRPRRAASAHRVVKGAAKGDRA